MVNAATEIFVIAVDSKVTGDVAHRDQNGVLHSQGMRTMEACSGLCLLEDGKGISTLLLIVVDRPPGVDPVPELQQPSELVGFTCNDFLQVILVAKSFQARIVVVLDCSEYLRSM